MRPEGELIKRRGHSPSLLCAVAPIVLDSLSEARALLNVGEEIPNGKFGDTPQTTYEVTKYKVKSLILMF